jgi:hypothetical protein
MPNVIAEALAAHLAKYPPGPGGVVFTNSLGRPLRKNTANDMWHRAADSAAVPKWATFHDLRHFYASMLIARGCSVKAVQRRLGHQSAMETLDTYGHLWQIATTRPAPPSTACSGWRTANRRSRSRPPPVLWACRAARRSRPRTMQYGTYEWSTPNRDWSFWSSRVCVASWSEPFIE